MNTKKHFWEIRDGIFRTFFITSVMIASDDIVSKVIQYVTI